MDKIKIAFFDAKEYDERSFVEANQDGTLSSGSRMRCRLCLCK